MPPPASSSGSTSRPERCTGSIPPPAPTGRSRPEQLVGAAVPRAAGGFALALRDGFATVDENGGALRWLAPVEADRPETRMNDGACDSAGRFWAGTTSVTEDEPTGSLYRLTPGGELATMLTGVTISNGIGWSPDDTVMYYVDTPPPAPRGVRLRRRLRARSRAAGRSRRSTRVTATPTASPSTPTAASGWRSGTARPSASTPPPESWPGSSTSRPHARRAAPSEARSSTSSTSRPLGRTRVASAAETAAASSRPAPEAAGSPRTRSRAELSRAAPQCLRQRLPRRQHALEQIAVPRHPVEHGAHREGVRVELLVHLFPGEAASRPERRDAA